MIITQSNLNDATQIQQIRQLVDQGDDAIVVCCSNPTALNASVEYAYNNDVAVFSGIGYLTSPYSVNSSANFVVGGRMMGEWMAEEIGGEGRVLNVEGIPGASASDSQNVGIEAAMAEWIGRGRRARRCYGFDEIALVPGDVTINPDEVIQRKGLGSISGSLDQAILDIKI